MNNVGPSEEYQSFYAHDNLRVWQRDAERHSFRADGASYGNPPTKRGIEFNVMPFYDEQVGAILDGNPAIALSKQTKKEIQKVVNMCRPIQVIGFSQQLLDSALPAPKKDKRGRKLECATCQGQHETDECRYPCHICIAAGPKSTHVCEANRRFMFVSQNRKRCMVVYQAHPPGKATDAAGDVLPCFAIKRSLYFRDSPVDWQKVFDAACAQFHGQILIVDNNTYAAWRIRLQQNRTLSAPFYIQAPPRMLAFNNVRHSVELLEKVYLPAVRARQMVRYRCPGTTLTLRRHWLGQREPDGLCLFDNFQPVTEVVMRLENYRPDEDALHAALGCATPGSAYYIVPQGKFEYNANGSLKVPRNADMQVLKERPYHPEGDGGKLELIFDTFGHHFDFHGGTVSQVKKPRDVFMKHLDALHLLPGDRDKIADLFDRSDDDLPITCAEYQTTRLLTDAGISPAVVENLAYEHTNTDEFGQRICAKVPPEVFNRQLRSLPKITGELYEHVQPMFTAAPDRRVYNVGECEFYDAFTQLPLTYDYFVTMAYYLNSGPLPVDLDVGSDEGLKEIEWILSVYKSYLANIEPLDRAAQNGVKELLGPQRGLGCLRVVCENFLGGPSTNAEAQAVIEGPRASTNDSARLWPHAHSKDEMVRFLTAVLPFSPNAEQKQALTRMVHNRLFVLVGLPGSGKTELTCAAVLYLMFVFGERILLLTETNVGALHLLKTLTQMMLIIETTFEDELTAARGTMRAQVGPKSTYRWITHSLAHSREFEEEDAQCDRVCQSKGRFICQVSRIVVSTLGHARSKAIQLFQADTIVVDEAARSTTPRLLATLLERWLNTSTWTTKITPDKDDTGRETKLCNSHPAQQLILVGDPVQGLPRLLGVPVTDKKVAWDFGEYDNLMTILMHCRAPFVRLNRSFRMSYYGVQPTLDRYYNIRVGSYLDAPSEVLAVKDAPAEIVARNELPLVEGKWLRCDGLRDLLHVKEDILRYDAGDNVDNLRLRHVIIRTNEDPPQNATRPARRLSFANKLGSQINMWHQELIRRWTHFSPAVFS